MKSKQFVISLFYFLLISLLFFFLDAVRTLSNAEEYLDEDDSD